MYASIGTAVPRGEGWTFEPKYDGIRVLAFVTPHEVRLVTRNGKDKTRQFPEVATDLQRLAAKAKRPLVLDGEVVALEGGEPARFQKLQSRMHVTGAADIARHAGKTPSALIVFDMLLDGGDVLLQEPWTVRRARLEKRLGKHVSEILRLGGTEQGDGEALLRKARETGWEGVIAKRTDSTYTPGARSPSWLKLKVEFRQELVVGGYTEPRNTRQHMGALIVGYYRGGELVYAGNVGGGFNARSLKAMWDRLAPLERKTSPFADPPKTAEPAHWVEPKIVVEVKFAEWTEDGKLRQPIYLGTRDDKPASEVTREDTSVQADEKPKRQRASSAVAQSAPADGGDGDSKPKKSARRASAGKAGASESAVRRASPESAKETGDAKRSASTDRRSSSGAETKPRKKAGASNDDESKKKASAAREAGAKKKPMGKQSDDAVRVKGAPVKVIAELRRIEEAGGSGRLELGRGVSLDVTHLGKTFFPEPGFTKGDLLRYYAQVSPLLLPAIRDRPLVLKRFPNGAAGEGFFQHKAGDVPPGVRVERVYPERGTEADRIVGGDLATLLYVAQIGSISVDPWHSRVQSPELADYTVIDLDPGDDAPFSTVVQVARWVKEEMDALGLHGALKTSGATGLHVFLPLPPNTPSEAGRLLAQLVATRVAVAHPREATVERAVRARATDSVYVDFMQNEVGKTVAGVYAVRARPEATVSTPLRWDELDDALDPRNFTLATVPARLAEAGDLWAPAMKRKNSLTSVLKRAGAG
jgi:bifunctional non-homologous end joining protein LigD